MEPIIFWIIFCTTIGGIVGLVIGWTLEQEKFLPSWDSLFERMGYVLSFGAIGALGGFFLALYIIAHAAAS